MASGRFSSLKEIYGLWKRIRLIASFKLRKESVIIILFVSFFTVVLIRNAWICDDAYITFRTVYNFVNGYGLTWNPGERVQVYTNPLWMFLMSAVYFLTREIYFTSIFFSITVSVVAILLFAFRIASSFPAALLGITVFTFSKAFIDYSTSGLENPLTHLILVIFMIVYLKSELNVKKLFYLSYIAAVGALNRVDMILLFLPALAYVFFRLPKLKGLYTTLKEFTLFILWECFSLLYYGFPFPNTFYAKVYTGISESELIRQGLYYLLNSINLDPLTLLIITSGITAPFLMKEWHKLPVAAGAISYILFVISIGGCFMSGRYLTAPLFIAVILFSSIPISSSSIRSEWLLASFIIIILIGMSSPYNPVISDANYKNSVMDANGIADERGVYYQCTGLLRNAQRNVDLLPNHLWSALGRKAREKGQSVIVWGNIGFYGFHAGPNVHIVDSLADPLLARLPAIEDPNWRIGHWRRMIPRGYLETLTSGQNMIKDKKLAAYYDKLRIITRGDLFDINRLIIIFNMNLGKYNHLIDYEFYRTGYKTVVTLSEINEPKAAGTPWNHPDNFLISEKGIKINLGEEYHAKRMEISLDNNDDYEIIYLSGSSEIANQMIQAHIIPQGGLAVYLIDVPQSAFENGYDSIKVIPLRGDGLYSIGHIRLLGE